MKIAIASDGKYVSGHFGHCEGSTMYEVEDNQVKGKEFVENPGHKPGFLPVFLNEIGVKVVISGGMGAGAIDIFNEKNIDVITGAKGNVVEAVTKFLAGDLISTGSVCHNHEHHNECGEHQ